MESFNPLSDKLRPEQPLPNGFDWEDMKDGVYQKMEDTSPDPINNKATKNKKPKRTIYALIATGVVIVLLLLKCNSSIVSDHFRNDLNTSRLTYQDDEASKQLKGDDKIKNKQSLKKSSIHRRKTQESMAITSKKEQTLPVANQAEIKENNGQEKALTRKNTDLIHERALQSDDKFSKNRKGKVSLSEKQNKKSIDDKSNINLQKSLNEHQNGLSVLSESKNTEKGNSTTLEDSRLKSSILIIQKIGIRAFSTQRNDNIEAPLWSTHLTTQKPPIPHPIAIAFGIGTNHWSPSWSGSTSSEERTQYEKGIFGQTASLITSYKLSSKVSVSTGLIWQVLFSRFDYNGIKQITRVTPNTVVEIIENTYNGTTRSVRGNANINVNQSRTVRHFNKYKSWSIPIIVNYHLSSNRLEYGAGIGTLLTIKTQSNGKTLINQEVGVFDQGNQIYKTGSALSILGQLELNYKLTDRIFFGSQLQISQSISNISVEQNTSIKPKTLSGLLRLGYRF